MALIRPSSAASLSGAAPRPPHPLAPTATESFDLPSGRSVAVPKATLIFTKWTSATVTDTYNGKAVLDAGGRPAFAELAILWSLRDAGWDGVWIDTFRRKYRTDYWGAKTVQLDAHPAQLLKRIYAPAGSRAGAWDVLCWRADKFLFVESKRRGHDSIRTSQLTFLDAALSIGLHLGCFLIAEWELRP